MVADRPRRHCIVAGVAARDVPAEGIPVAGELSAWRRRHCPPSSFAGSARWTRKSGSARSASSCSARRSCSGWCAKRRSIRIGRSTRRPAWLRSNVSQNISVPLPIGKQTDNQKGPDSFILGYTDSDPQRAQRITNRLAYVFAEENSKQQLERSENTSEILSQQLQASQARLSRLEGQLREKKQAYMGRLPDQVNANVQMVNGLRSQLESISTQLRGEQDRLSMVETQIEQMKQGTGRRGLHELRRGRGAGGAEAHQRSAAAARSGARAGLHRQAPGSRSRCRRSSSTRRRSSPTRAGPMAVRHSPGRSDVPAEAPGARHRAADDPGSAALVAAGADQIGQYQSRVDAAPMVEQELASLTREYEFEKTHYADLTLASPAGVDAPRT